MKRDYDLVISSDEEDAPPPLRKTFGGQGNTVGSPSQREQATNSSSARLSSAATTTPAVASSFSSTKDKQPDAAVPVPTRAQMEMERRARQAAREAAAGEGQGVADKPRVSLKPEVKRPKVASLSDLVDPAAAGPSTTTVASSSSGAVHGFGTTAEPYSTSGLYDIEGSAGRSGGAGGDRITERYWSGSLVRTSHARYPDSTSFDFPHVIGPKPELKVAIVSAFCLDFDMVLELFHGEFPLMMVTQEKGLNGGAVRKLDENLRKSGFLVLPPMGTGMGSMHVKGFVLFYETWCRIVIPTANAEAYDWNSIENALWIQDFPLRNTPPPSNEIPYNNPTHTQFSRSLYVYMDKMGCGKRFLAPFSKYDFSNSSHVRLVTSRQGWYESFDSIPSGGGIDSLARAVKSFNFSPGGFWTMEATGSSIGNLAGPSGENWLLQMLAAVNGVAPEEYYTKKTPYPAWVAAGGRWKERIKIAYPTLAEMDASFNGRQGGGTLFFPSKYWRNEKWPRHLLYQGRSKRDRVIAHTKHIVAIHKPGLNPPAGFRHEGFIYTGSHNFTPSAWGTLSQAHAHPKIGINNWEMGTIIKIEGDSEADVEAKASELATYKRPLVPYGPNDEPWQQDIYLE